MTDHDRLFKELLTTFFVEFVSLFFPEMGDYLDPDGLVFLDKEVFTDVTEGEKHEVDIVVRARFRAENGVPPAPGAFFLVHVENQSSAEPQFGRRLFRYWARLFEKYGLPVYPIVVFSYETPKREEPDRFDVTFPDLPVLDFRYRVIQLNRLSWRDYMDKHNPVASALMAKMSVAPQDRWRVKLECLRLLATLRLDRARMRLISGFVDTYLELTKEEESHFEAALTTGERKPQEEVMEIVTSWMRKGIAQGLEQGLQQGMEKGKEQILLRQLQSRFGPLNPAILERIEALSPNRLDDLAIALLDFSGATDIDTWLAGNVS